MDYFTWKPIAGTYAHLCPFSAGLLIDEHDPMIVDCRCYHSSEFFRAQDKQAVALDLLRGETK